MKQLTACQVANNVPKVGAHNQIFSDPFNIKATMLLVYGAGVLAPAKSKNPNLSTPNDDKSWALASPAKTQSNNRHTAYIVTSNHTLI